VRFSARSCAASSSLRECTFPLVRFLSFFDAVFICGTWLANETVIARNIGSSSSQVNTQPAGLLVLDFRKQSLTTARDLACIAAMKKKFFVFGAICAGAGLLAGCVNTIDGRTGVGIPLVKDTVSARYDRPVLEIWAAAKAVLKDDGTLYSEDTLRSTLEAAVDTRTVWVKVEPVDQRVTKLSVQVRTKGGGADIGLAGQIDKEIALRLQSGNVTPSIKATN